MSSTRLITTMMAGIIHDSDFLLSVGCVQPNDIWRGIRMSYRGTINHNS